MENILKIAICVLAGLFAVLHIIAAVSQLAKKKSPAASVLMLGGALEALAAGIDCLIGGSLDWLFMLVGGVMVCAAAIMNGRAAGKLNPLHHIIRGVLAAGLTLAFLLV